ncbi:hypothetical protein BDR04DRAFT_1117888 [Suillus decipiens]|nr:hypothetical protein BDR04DRAFT_1117888 [Suillus decipiens]
MSTTETEDTSFKTIFLINLVVHNPIKPIGKKKKSACYTWYKVTEKKTYGSKYIYLVSKPQKDAIDVHNAADFTNHELTKKNSTKRFLVTEPCTISWVTIGRIDHRVPRTKGLIQLLDSAGYRWFNIFYMHTLFNAEKEFEPKDAAITSIYFDNEDLELYLGRLEKTEGAEAIRLRWYGDMDVKTIFVERKTHREDWTGEKSVKARFPIKEHLVNAFLRGEYTMDAELQALVDKGKKTQAEVDSDSACKRGLVSYSYETAPPGTFCNRTVFKLPGDLLVWISFDTELTIVREGNWDGWARTGNNWRRTDIGINHPFDRVPEEDQELFKGVFCTEQFHNMLTFFQGIAFWKSNFRFNSDKSLHRPRAVPPRRSCSQVQISCHSGSIGRKVHLFIFFALRFNISVHGREGQEKTGMQIGGVLCGRSTVRYPVLGFRVSVSTANDVRTHAIIKATTAAEGREANAKAPLRVQDGEVLEAVDMDEENIREEERLLVRDWNAPSGKRIAVPVRVRPKVSVTNERTFLKWLSFAVLVGSIATTLLNFVSADEPRGLISAALLAIAY